MTSTRVTTKAATSDQSTPSVVEDTPAVSSDPGQGCGQGFDR